jgi:hypothetical protein
MKRNPQGKNIIRTRAIAIVALVVVIVLLDLIDNHPKIIERWYSQGLYLWICRAVHPILNLFPFSVGDVLYLAVIILIIYYFIKLVRLLFKKQFKQVGILIMGAVVSTLGAVVAFYVLWGINYFRPSAAERLKLRDSNYSTAQLEALTKVVIDSANVTRARLTSADLSQSDKTIKQTAIDAVLILSSSSKEFLTYSPRIKSSMFTPVISILGTSGYYNPFTTEAQMNYAMPVFLKPFVACHELSHQMGYGPEDEANFVGFFAGIRSTDRLLQYSAWHEAVDECMRDLMQRDTVLHKKMKLLVSPAVHADFVAERDFWVAHESKLNIISDIFYDNFLKANNQPQGLMTYNRMVRLVMALYNKKEFGQPHLNPHR